MGKLDLQSIGSSPELQRWLIRARQIQWPELGIWTWDISLYIFAMYNKVQTIKWNTLEIWLWIWCTMVSSYPWTIIHCNISFNVYSTLSLSCFVLSIVFVLSSCPFVVSLRDSTRYARIPVMLTSWFTQSGKLRIVQYHSPDL